MTVVAEVKGTYYPVQGVRAHQVSRARQTLRVGDKVDAVVDTGYPRGDDAESYGDAFVACGAAGNFGEACEAGRVAGGAGHLRFDFSHFTAVEDEELQDIEDMINKEVLRNLKVETIDRRAHRCRGE